MRSRARLIVPEVVQSSNLDCGPAALKCMLEGFGVHVHYGRLREACQTDVDGTSIDTLEEVANQLGLEAEQIMLPRDHVLVDESHALPAIAVVLLPNGMTHFVIVWRRHGPFVQLMDPATGRRWISGARLLSELYVHKMPVSSADWREYAGTGSFLDPLGRRMEDLGIGSAARSFIAHAVANPNWRPIGALDAGVRLLASIVRSKTIRAGDEAARVLESFLENDETIPEHYWSVRPGPDHEQLLLSGAVLVRARGLHEKTASRRAPSSPELAAALRQPSTRPGLELLRLLAQDGLFTPVPIVAALLLAAGAVVVEAMLFRALLDLTGMLSFPGLRLGAIAALIVFSVALLLLEIPLTGNLLRLGRRLEVRLRLAFLRKIPRLPDRYFQSRLKSDMAERSHSIHRIRRLPELAGQLLRYSFEIAFTAAGIVWLDPASAAIAIVAALTAMLIPLVSEPLLMERDLRVRTHAGALTHFYLDALLGLVAIHSHGAQRAVRREHESLLAEWARAGMNLQRIVISLETVQFLAGFGLAIWLVASHLARNGEIGAVLLLVYWALNLPALGQEIGLIAWQYPAYRNMTLRLLEPLGALERTKPPSAPAADLAPGPAAIAFQNVSVTVSGHSVLHDIDLSIEAGNHVAIVGASGAGKSSLVGLLLGWYRPAMGQVLVNGLELDEQVLETLRPRVAWVDPAVQLWNRTLFENLAYGRGPGAASEVDRVVGSTGLGSVIERLPEGQKTPLGEGGGLVSGGEGQRVRFARALLRPDIRLVVLDEPFRGLDSRERKRLLTLARESWREATLLWISHDIDETLGFDRVLVLEDGRIAEDGNPRELISNPDSRLHAMHLAERAVRDGLWSSAEWRRLRLENGVLTEP